MADNFTANPGSGGAVFASDDVGGVQWPRVKIAFGADGTATEVQTSDPLPVSVLNFPATQAVTQSGVWSVGVTGSVAVTGPLTDAQLRAAAVPVSGTVTANLGTIAGVATETTLAAINTKTLAAGQATMAASSPVVIASNQSAIPVSQSGTWNIGAITTLPALPAGSNTIGNVNVNKQALTAGAPTTATVGVASGAAVASNANRKGLYLRNTSTSGQRISLAFSGGTAVLDSGVTLEAGDAFVMGEHDFSTGAVNAISSGASGRLSVQEWT